MYMCGIHIKYVTFNFIISGVVGGAGVADGQITTNNEEEVPIDEDLFAAEEIDEELLDMENLELEDNVEPNPLDVTTSG